MNSYTEGIISDIVGDVLGQGSVSDVISGDVNPGDAGWTADGGKYSRSHRHTDELGADMKFNDPATGKAVNLSRDDVIRNDLAMGFAADNSGVGLGFGPGYMGDETMHVDFSGKGGMWGPGWTQLDKDNVEFARKTGIGPTPRLDAPTPTANPGVDSPVADYSGGGTSKYGLDTAVSRYDTPKEKNAKSISRSVADSAANTAGKTTRSESTESAKEAAKSDKDKNDKSSKSESSKSSESSKGEKSDSGTSKSDKGGKSSASKESSKSKNESKGKDHSKGGHYAD